MHILAHRMICWQHLEGEARRLVAHFQSMPPHLVKSTLSLNRTRELIHQLTRPMADITQTIETTIRINEANIETLSQYKLEGDDLRSRLDFQKLVLVAIKLQKPRTVCSDLSCLEYRDDGYGEKKTVYTSRCHSSCYLSSVPQKAVGPPEIASCAAFYGGNQHCTSSKNHWMKHLHVIYELREEMAMVKDKAIEKQLQKNASDIDLQQSAIDSLKRQIAEAREEHAKIQEAAAKFGMFLNKTQSCHTTTRCWSDLVQSDNLLFHTMLLTVAFNLERRIEKPNIFYSEMYVGECIRLLRDRIQDPVYGASNPTIGAVTTLSCLAVSDLHYIVIPFY